MNADEDDLGVWREPLDLPCSFEPAHTGHADIQKDNVGMQGVCELNCFHGAFCFVNHFDTLLFLQKLTQTDSERFIVVDDDDS